MVLSKASERVIVYTAIAGGGRDSLIDPVPVPGVDYVCFTDQPLKSDIWQIRPFSWKHSTENVRTAKHPKVLPHLYFPGHDLSIWIDGNITPGPDIQTIANLYLQQNDLALHRHPRRRCLYKEAAVVSEAKKDHPDIINKTILRYRKEGMPRNFGLWECGILFRRHHIPAIKQSMELWWQEIERGTQSDQMPFAYVMWSTGLSFRTIEGNLRESPFFAFTPHEELYWGKLKVDKPKLNQESGQGLAHVAC